MENNILKWKASSLAVCIVIRTLDMTPFRLCSHYTGYKFLRRRENHTDRASVPGIER